MCSLGLGLTNQIRIAHLDICSQAKYTDMARYWIDFEEIPVLDQLFVSWNSVIGMLDDDWQKWSYDIWNQLGDGGTTYWQAQDYASKHNDKGSFILQPSWYNGYLRVATNEPAVVRSYFSTGAAEELERVEQVTRRILAEQFGGRIID